MYYSFIRTFEGIVHCASERYNLPHTETFGGAIDHVEEQSNSDGDESVSSSSGLIGKLLIALLFATRAAYGIAPLRHYSGDVRFGIGAGVVVIMMIIPRLATILLALLLATITGVIVSFGLRIITSFVGGISENGPMYFSAASGVVAGLIVAYRVISNGGDDSPAFSNFFRGVRHGISRS